MLVNSGEVALLISNPITVNSTSVDPASPAVDISRPGATAPGATLWLTSSSGSSFTSQGVTVIGNQAGSAGRLIVDTTSNIRWGYTTKGIIVGNDGNGTLIIEDNAYVSNTANAFIASGAGSIGSVTVTNGGDWYNDSGSLFVGGNQTSAGGVGTLTVGNAGEVRVGGTLKLWDQGTLTLDGGAIQTQSFDQTVGTFNFNNGTLTVVGGSFIQPTGSLTINGNTVSANPTLVLRNGATTDGVTSITVGNTNKGSVSIESGADLVTTTGILASQAGSTGTATVTGSGSTWTNSGDLYVGGNASAAGGSGSLTVSNGGHLDVGGTLKTWNSGSVTLNGGSITTESFDRSVGSFNFQGGTLTIDGGTYTQPTGILSVSGVPYPSMNPTMVFANGATANGVAAVVVGGNFSQYGSLVIQGGSTVTNSGSGNLGIIGSQTVYGGNGYLGLNGGTTGLATVTGAGSTWTNSGSLYVGGSSTSPGGTGSLTVSNGGHVEVGGTLKTWYGGTVTLNGGSITTQSFDQSSGTFNFNDGTLTIDGGTYTRGSQSLIINGNTASANPTLVLANGAYTPTVVQLVVGSTRQGTLIISGGSDLVNLGTAVIGYDAGSAGTVTVSGPGSTWTNQQSLYNQYDLYVGYLGSGTLNVENGGAVSNRFGFLGYYGGSTGMATVTGPGSTWTNQYDLLVGYSGSGTLNVENGGAVSNRLGYLGYHSGSTGTATVTGPGSTWTNQYGLYVGYYGSGTLSVENGGAVSNTTGYLGLVSGSTGTATVTGPGSTWTNQGSLSVGNYGNGTLNVEEGGAVSNTTGYLGRISGFTGTATVTGDGSTWTNSDSLYVGGNESAAGGTGNLTVTNGGHVDVGGTLKIWNSGTVTLNGGSITTQSFDNDVGTFNFHDGTLTVDGGTYRGLDTLDGNTTTANPTLVLTNGATASIAYMTVGATRQGTLVVSNGADLQGFVGWIGYDDGSSGSVTVTGPNSAWSVFGLQVGVFGSGSLTVSEGGSVTSAYGEVGPFSGSSGTVLVTGAGSTWTTINELEIGGNGSSGGTGSVTVTDGGLVTASTATVWSTGTVSVGNGGTLSVTNAITNGGLIEVATGGMVTAASIDNQGTLLNDGTINAAVTATNGGMVGGTGTFSDLTIGDGGFADPGASPGTMNSTLTAWNGGGTYLWEINSLTGTAGMDPGWDLWNTGTLTIGATNMDPFTISLNTLDSGNSAGLLGSWNASSNYSWLIATSTNNAFVSLSGLLLDWSGFLNPLSGGFFSLVSGAGGNELYVNFTSGGPSPVPEPSSLVLLGCAAGGLFAGYRRRNATRSRTSTGDPQGPVSAKA